MSIGPYCLGDVRPRKVGILTAQAVTQYDLVGLSSGNAVRAEDTAWASAVATPSAPTVAASQATRGTALTNAATNVKVSVQFPWGEGALSAAAAATPTAHFGLQVTLVACPAPGLWWNVYVETSASSGVYQLQQIVPAAAGAAIIYVDSYGAGNVPAASPVTSGALDVTQYNFSQIFMGLSHQTKAAAIARPYGGSEDNMLMVHISGVFWMPCASATFTVGQYVGPAKATGNALLSQKVIGVAGKPLAIGQVAEAITSGTAVKVGVFSPLQLDTR